MRIALLFPGQGSQTAGFLHRLPEHPAVRAVFGEATAFLAKDVLSLDSNEALASTVAAQMGLLTAGVAFTSFLMSEGIAIDAAVGMSVGAFAAAVAAGVLSFQSALRFVRRRAELMESALPAVFGMAAVAGLREAVVNALIVGNGVRIANLNARTQFVIAGRREDLASVLPLLTAAGATTTKMLRMATSSHIPELSVAAHELLEFARGIPMQDAAIPVFSNRTARPLLRAEDIRKDLAMNMAHPVRWLDVQTALLGYVPSLLLEAPPGQTLTHLMQDSFPQSDVLAAESVRWDVLLREARKVLRAE